MGLDVTAYERAERISGHEPTDDDHDHGIIEAFAYAVFDRALDGMGDTVLDTRTGVDCLSAGYWRTGGDEATAQTSYAGYGLYRDRLARAVIGMEYRKLLNFIGQHGDAPYFDLLNFADNEGVIGPVAARRLADDFASTPVKFDEAWMNKFHDDLRDCFDLAADTGLALFG